MRVGEWYYDPRPLSDYNYMELLSDGDAEEVEISTFHYVSATRVLKGPNHVRVAGESFRALVKTGEIVLIDRSSVPFLLEM